MKITILNENNSRIDNYLFAEPVKLHKLRNFGRKSIVDFEAIKPTIIDSIVKKFTDSDETETIKNTPQIISQIIRSEVCEEMKKALFEVMEENGEVGNAAKIEGYRLWAKSGTSQIAYKGKYQRWEWWTQGTFVGIVPIDNPEYIVLIWTSRPRTNQWWWFTSGRVFKEVAKFLIGYSLIEWESK